MLSISWHFQAIITEVLESSGHIYVLDFRIQIWRMAGMPSNKFELSGVFPALIYELFSVLPGSQALCLASEVFSDRHT